MQVTIEGLDTGYIVEYKEETGRHSCYSTSRTWRHVFADVDEALIKVKEALAKRAP